MNVSGSHVPGVFLSMLLDRERAKTTVDSAAAVIARFMFRIVELRSGGGNTPSPRSPKALASGFCGGASDRKQL